MSQIEIDQAGGADLRLLVERVRGGEDVTLAEGGRVLARIVAVEATSMIKPPRQLGRPQGRFKVADGFDALSVDELFAPAKQPLRLGLLAGKATVPPDFDAPLPDDLLDLFEGR